MTIIPENLEGGVGKLKQINGCGLWTDNTRHYTPNANYWYYAFAFRARRVAVIFVY